VSRPGVVSTTGVRHYQVHLTEQLEGLPRQVPNRAAIWSGVAAQLERNRSEYQTEIEVKRLTG